MRRDCNWASKYKIRETALGEGGNLRKWAGKKGELIEKESRSALSIALC